MSLTLGNNFEWALQRLKEGKKVRREVWKDFNGYIFISSSGNLVYSENTYSNRDYTVNSKGINATDWELVEDKYNLSKEIFTFSQTIEVKRVKEFIKRVKDLINVPVCCETDEREQAILGFQEAVTKEINKLAGDKLL